MTMPHLMNCAHTAEGWCLDCVRELHDSPPDNAVELAAYRRALEQIVDEADCDPVQVALSAMAPFTNWVTAPEIEGITIKQALDKRTPMTAEPDGYVACLREARMAASHDSAEPLYSHRAWRAMLRTALYFVDRYDELIMAVAQKWPNETRFQTALRYINEREDPSRNCGVASNAMVKHPPGWDSDSGK